MLYSNLNDIPLYTFNQILLGDNNAVVIDGKHNKEEINYTAQMLVSEYYMILGTSSKEVCIMYEDALNNQRMLLIARCGLDAQNFDMSVSLEASRYLGYNGDKDKVIEYLEKKEKYYSQRYELSRIAIEKYKKEHENEPKITEKDLANERAALIMSGIPLDQHRISAMEYAFLLKSKIEESKMLKSKMQSK